MEMTLVEANKLVKKYQEALLQKRAEEKERSTYVASIQEDSESNRIDFVLSDYVNDFENIINDIKTLKHKINVYNSTIVLEDVHLTIDEALLLLPILNDEKKRFGTLASMPKKKRISDGRYSSSIIDYQYVNFDTNEAKVRYDSLVDYINKIQFSLDKINSTLLLEF